MKSKDQQLLEEAYREVLVENTQAVDAAFAKFKAGADAIIELVKTGALNPSQSLAGSSSDDFEDEVTLKSTIEQFVQDVNSARRKYTASKVSPETRKAAAQKAKATVAKDKAEAAKWRAQSQKEHEAYQKRLDQGYLPDNLYNSKGTPNQKYYVFDRRESDGYMLYRLRPEYQNVAVGKGKRVPDSVLWPEGEEDTESQYHSYRTPWWAQPEITHY
jgi:hypothetical protein